MTTRIRLATPDDADAIAAIYAPAIVDNIISFELEPPSGEEMARRVAKVQALAPWLVCEQDGAIAGYAYAGLHRERHAYQWSMESTAYVAADAHRCGVARGLYTSLFAALVYQGFVNVYAGITLPNAASVGFHEAMGFTPVGVYRGVGYKLGKWRDVIWLERALAPRVLDPRDPVPLPQLRDDPRFLATFDVGLPHIHLEEGARPSRTAFDLPPA